MAATLTQNEEAQLSQTIEMFEVITQSQPMDYQSLEILKEAYSKLSNQKAVVQTSKRIAEAYVQLGQLSSAILEYESILQRYPDDPDVHKALAEIESKANSFGGSRSTTDTDSVDRAAGTPKKAAAATVADGDVEDGKQQMRKVFLDAKLISQGDFDMFWPTPNMKEAPRAVQEPFIHVLAEKQVLPVDKSLKLLAEKSRMAYMPIDKYDVDIELARSFPKETCLRWCVLPFDKLSKSIMVATANPFNKQAARELESLTKSRLVFYLAAPVDMVKMLKKIYR